MKEISIRLRLAIWYSAVLMAGMILLGYTAWAALQQRLIDELDQRIAQQADGFCAALEAESIAVEYPQLQEEMTESVRQMPAGSVIQIRSKSGMVIALSSDVWPMNSGSPAGTEFSTVEHNGHRFRTLSKQIYCSGQPLAILVANPSQQIDNVMRTLRTILLTINPGVLLIACLGGWWISRRALAPVDDLTKAAKSITLQNLSQRLAVPQTGDELQRMAEAWNDVLARLETAVARIRQLTADASHELRTPIALIRATAELALRRERDSESYRQSLREILSESEQMTRLANDLLFLTAADANPLDMPLSPIHLNGILSEAAETNAALAESRGIHLKLEDSPENDWVTANEAGIKRLLLILVDNALKYTPPEGSVVISTSRDKTGITISVKDSGLGIPAEALPHIFERFYRADTSHNYNGGAGLGLSIAQMIALAHGSPIRVESTPGTGSCFSIHLKN